MQCLSNSRRRLPALGGDPKAHRKIPRAEQEHSASEVLNKAEGKERGCQERGTRYSLCKRVQSLIVFNALEDGDLVNSRRIAGRTSNFAIPRTCHHKSDMLLHLLSSAVGSPVTIVAADSASCRTHPHSMPLEMFIAGLLPSLLFDFLLLASPVR